MLSYIMGLVQAFERGHGFKPQMVCLNPRHLRQLLVEYPDVDPEKFFSQFGLRILLIQENDLPHPRVVWLPPMMSTGEVRPVIDRFPPQQAA